MAGLTVTGAVGFLIFLVIVIVGIIIFNSHANRTISELHRKELRKISDWLGEENKIISKWLREESRILAMSPEEREYYEAQKEYHERIERARDALSRLERHWKARCDMAQERLNEARQPEISVETYTGPSSTTTKRKASVGGAAVGGYVGNKLNPAWTPLGVGLGMLAGGKEKHTVVEKHTVEKVIPPDPASIAAAERYLESVVADKDKELALARMELEAARQKTDRLMRAEQVLAGEREQIGDEQPEATTSTSPPRTVNFCAGCGAKVAPGESFCVSCGRPVERTDIS